MCAQHRKLWSWKHRGSEPSLFFSLWISPSWLYWCWSLSSWQCSEFSLFSFTGGWYPAYQTCGSLIVQHCTSCCFLDWAPGRGGLVLSGTCRWGTVRDRKLNSVLIVGFMLGSLYSAITYKLFCFAFFPLTQRRAGRAWCLERGWWGCTTACCLGLSSHLTPEEKRLERQDINSAQDTEQEELHPLKRQKCEVWKSKSQTKSETY